MPLMPGADPFSHAGGPVGALLLHGFAGSPRSMRPWADRLATEGLSVELPRLPGHGTRWQDMAVTRWEDWYAEADRSLTLLRERSATTFVLGLAMGATLALRLAQQRPDDVAGLVLVNPWLRSHRRGRRLLPLGRLVVKSLPGIGNDIAKPGTDEGCYDRLPLQPAYSLVQAASQVSADLPRVVAPLLLLHSRHDHVVEPGNAAAILSGVSSKDRTEVWLENSFHVATLDHDATLIESRSIEFVHRVAPGSVQG